MTDSWLSGGGLAQERQEGQESGVILLARAKNGDNQEGQNRARVDQLPMAESWWSGPLPAEVEELLRARE